MSLVKYELPPGILRRGTVYETMGRWYSGNLCRWHEGAGPMPIGGWAARTVGAITGKGRAMLTWVDNDTIRYIAVGTQSKLYATTSSSTTMYDITPAGFTTGYADGSAAGGYGSGDYGEGTYGTPRVDVAAIQDASMWTLDAFGELLVGCMSDDGKIYEWGLDTGAPATQVTNAPTACVGCVVTPERFLVALGAGGDKRTVQWSDQEARTVWTPSSTNQAGDLALATYGRIMAGRRLRSATLIWTDLDVHLMTYIGLPYVYRIERQGENCGLISRGAMVAADTRAIWMSQGDFYMYDGFVQPITCEIHDAVFGDMNSTQRSKFTAQHRAKYSEVWFLYCSAASTEIDRAAVWNYHENHWNLHDFTDLTTTRLCGADAGVMQNPIMVGNDGILYDHETGSTYDSATPAFESGPLEIGAGDKIARVKRLIFDERTSGDVSLSIKVADWTGDSETTYGPYTSDNPTPVRIAGRKWRLSGEFTTPSTSSRWGVLRADIAEGGMR